MSKAHRGPGIRAEANHGRGKCPRCGKENIKTLWEKEIEKLFMPCYNKSLRSMIVKTETEIRDRKKRMEA